MLMLQETYKTIGKVIEEKTGVPDAQLIDGGEHADLATTSHLPSQNKKNRHRP